MKLIDAMDKGHETVEWTTGTFDAVSPHSQSGRAACAAGLAAYGLGYDDGYQGNWLQGMPSPELARVCRINNTCSTYEAVKERLRETGLADLEVS